MSLKIVNSEDTQDQGLKELLGDSKVQIIVEGTNSDNVEEAASECYLKAFEFKVEKDKESFVRGY